MRPSSLLAATLLATTHALAAPPPEECPQPRFTGKAPDEYLARKNPLDASTDLAAAERAFLKGVPGAAACADCHGEKGDGRGKLAGLFEPRPRNFRCAQTVAGIPDGQLFWIIRYGSPGASMPPHPKLTDEQVWSLVLYLRRLAR